MKANEPSTRHTVRDWIAVQAMQGMLANPCMTSSSILSVARVAYNIADAMIAESERRGKEGTNAQG